MNLRTVPLVLLAVLAVLQACHKDPAQSGCTDPLASNYDPSALESDGSCQYNQELQLIWDGGLPTGWNGDLFRGAITPLLCKGDTSLLALVDTSLMAPDDTTAPAQQDSTQKQLLQLGANAEGQFEMLFQVLNPQNARSYANGVLEVGLRKAPDSLLTPPFIDFFIQGKLVAQSCEMSIRRSHIVQVSTQSLTDSTFAMLRIPLDEFDQKILADATLLCGITFNSSAAAAVQVDHIYWRASAQP